jgi:L-ascorbate metabolism protein UlaG (beta-lactamase superfamily)
MRFGPTMPQSKPSSSNTGELAIMWLGHATVLIELDGSRVLTDPVLLGRAGPLVRIAPAPDIAALEGLDCVLLSHLHADHTDIRSLRLVARDVPVLAPQPARQWLRRRGLLDVRELSAGEEVAVGTLRIQAVRASHPRKRAPIGPAADPLGYLINDTGSGSAIGSGSVYFAGDTDLFDEMAQLHGIVDVALLPVSGWGPRVPAGHLDPQRAAEAARIIAPRVAIPIHWGTLARPRPASRPADPEAPAREFEARVARIAPSVAVRVLAPGESTVI